ncbi:Cleaved like [Actinidia chinensis var. chinensis]|uniref:Cleaved like n=1 Tax=Actinidia chinensis var. chinensis TaxID=1590841 RepID=A0A2R6R9L7_ACTCC|nr:Cleaved like [Actinidia chinensis var. chinensis]
MHPIKDLFPYHRNQMPYAQHYYPSFESIPPQMKVDALRSPVTCGTWPYESHFGHSIPVGCHGCCTHSYFPGYSGFRPAYPHYLPPTPYHYHGGYPSFSETYPVQFVPLSPYSMDQPRYEYDKNKDRDHHCCGCPYHPVNKIEDKLVQTEEQEQEFGKKSSKSLVPVELKNQPYPVVYLPSDYVKREKRNLAEPELKERDEYPYENQKPSERLPRDWSKWFPFDVDGFGSLNHGGDRKGTQEKPNEDENQVSFPIYLMPYKPQEEEKMNHKEARTFIDVNTGRVSSESSPFELKATSAHFPNSDEKSGQEVFIPVKQLEEHEETMMKEEAEAKSRGITVKDKDDNKEKQPSENGNKRQSSSPPKKSKLPPVCLRVDPLPNRKKGNGSLRSSPPDHKGKLHQLCVESTKAASPREKERAHHGMQSSSCIVNETKEVEPNEKKRRVVVVADGYGDDCKIRSQAQVPVSFPIISHKNVSANRSASNGGSADDVRSVKEDKEVEVEEEKSGGLIGSAEEEIPVEVKKPKWENLSEAEAAVAIQSAYRRFEVRRWEPLKKMKLIAEVREQVGSVKCRVEALENSPDISSDNKQMVVIGETIMSLLLKLDTIQGLHPCIRDFRKSVVKELVSLQEKLDSIATKESVVSSAKLVEDLPLNTGEYVCSQGEQKEAEFGQEKGIGVSNNHNNFGSQAMETSDPKLDEKEVCDEPEDKSIASSFESGVGSTHQGLHPSIRDFRKSVVKELVSLQEKLDSIATKESVVSTAKLVEDLPVNTGEYLYSQGEQKEAEFGQEKGIGESNNNNNFSSQAMETSDRKLDEKEVCDEPEYKTIASSFENGVDSIYQGLHPSIRDELVILQEKLDSIAAKESVVSTAKLVEDLPVNTGEYVCSQGEQKEAEFRQEKSIGESNNHNNFGSQAMETSDPKLDEKEVCDEPEDKTIVSSFESSVESREAEAEAVNQLKDGSNYEVIDDGQVMMLKTGVEDQELKLPVEPLPMDAEENVNLADEVTRPSCPGDQVEFPWVSGEVHAVEESQRNERIEAGESEVLQRGEVESLLAINLTSMDFEETYQVQQPLDALKEEQVFADPVDETKGERVSDFNEELDIKQAELPVQTQGEEFGRIIEPEAGAKRHEGGELLPVSPMTRKVCVRGDMASESDRKLLEENEKLRDMMVKLIEAGREQLTTLSNLSNRVKDLEKKLARKKKVRMRRTSAGSSCVNPANDSLKGRAHGIAV